MSEKFEKSKKYYDLGLWDETQLRKAVAKNWISASEFQQITGKGILGE